MFSVTGIQKKKDTSQHAGIAERKFSYAMLVFMQMTIQNANATGKNGEMEEDASGDG